MSDRISIEQCILCGSKTRNGRVDRDRMVYFFDCESCGSYGATMEACDGIMGTNHLLYRAATRQASEAGCPLTLKSSDLADLARDHEGTTIERNLEKLISFVAHRTLRPGRRVQIDSKRDFPVIDTEDASGFNFILAHAEELGLLREMADNLYLTPAGWDRLSNASGGFVPGRCFVAMAFKSGLTDAFHDGIRAAVELDCGFEAVRMLELEHNDKICDRIIVEIRRAQFVIADFTFQRGGVYFEAGFAAALQRPVIWTCKACHFRRLHFDTRQYNHIKWETPADLRSQLAARIRGTIPGARLT